MLLEHRKQGLYYFIGRLIFTQNYDIKNANDIAYALKDMFKDTIQTMMNAEFDSSIGYEKSDNKIEKSNYRNRYSSKKSKKSIW